jgi:hypothetical protein
LLSVPYAVPQPRRQNLGTPQKYTLHITLYKTYANAK